MIFLTTGNGNKYKRLEFEKEKVTTITRKEEMIWTEWHPINSNNNWKTIFYMKLFLTKIKKFYLKKCFNKISSKSNENIDLGKNTTIKAW